MANPDQDHGFIYDHQGRIDVLKSPVFDINLEIDHTVEDYIDRIQFSLRTAIDDQQTSKRIPQFMFCFTSIAKKPDFKSQISVVHEKIDGNLSILEEMLKKLLEGQPKTVSSEAREATCNQESGENPNPKRRREDQEMKILEGEMRMPYLEPILRE
ncbi:hypothetical protein M5K25_023213 [Dendrobium thyrsiflorum]|uniref:Uncharacterized protein n=1 Tax=Dendrobium thyrsiflorum TaxID=117978 RepID=A0ABD0UEA3_DENTH